MKSTSKLAVSVFALAASSVPVHAQDVSDAPSDDIVVTARRVSERLSDVPVAITAVQGDRLDTLGVRTVLDVRQAVAGLQITYSAGRNATPVYTIRGQRADDTLLTQDQPITVYIDETILSPAQGSNLGLFDIENVQVLKGPQGTLFGRNTTGGAILFTTAKPTDRFEGSLRVGYGNFDARTLTAVLNVPVNDKIRLRGAVDYTRTDGYGRIVAGANAGQRLFDRDELNLRFTAAVNPTDNFSTMTTLYHSRSDSGGVAFTLLETPNPHGAASLVFGEATLADAYDRARKRSVYDAEDSRGRQFARTRVLGVIHTDTLELSDELTFKNIFSYRDVSDDAVNDFDGTLLPVLDPYNSARTKAYSEEAQLQGRAFDDRLNYIFGVYYYLLKGIDGTGLPGTDATVQFGMPGTVYGRVKNSSFSGFAQATYKLTDNMNLTGGLRYTLDNRVATLTNGSFPLTSCIFVDAQGQPLPASDCFVKNEKAFSKPSYLFSIDRKFGDTLVYLTHRFSYRAGGFNLRASTLEFAAANFQPETVKDLELGIKTNTELGGGIRLTANIAGYYQWYNDVQKGVSVVGADGNVGTVVQNAAKATIHGGEAELGLRFGSIAELNVNYAYTKPEYKNYLTLTSVGGETAQPDDYSDRRFKYVPRHQLNANFAVTPDIGDFGELRLIANVYYQSRVFITEDYQNRAQLIRRISAFAAATLPTDTVFSQKGYALVNGRIELNDIAGSGLSAAVFGRNLFDKRYVDSAIPFEDSVGLATGVYGAPRTYGVEATFRF